METDEKQQPVDIESLSENRIAMLDKIWECILQQYQKKSEDHSREFGAGISCFMILKNPSEGTNCKYCYGGRSEEDECPWNIFVLQAPNRKTFLRAYNPETNYAIGISVPAEENLTASIKLFKFDTGEEIILPNEDPESNTNA